MGFDTLQYEVDEEYNGLGTKYSGEWADGKTLLITAGPTYCNRLWCVMECFTFLRMGGSHERIEIDLIANQDKEPELARKELKANFASFDAEKAECFLERDRQRLLAVVEAGFGNFKDFNVKMREVFDERVSV